MWKDLNDRTDSKVRVTVHDSIIHSVDSERGCDNLQLTLETLGFDDENGQSNYEDEI